MTEKKWLTAADPEPMLKFLRAKVSDRKMRLFAVACCYQVWHLLIDIENRTAVEMAEVFADGGLAAEGLLRFHNEAYPLYEQYTGELWHAARSASSSAWYFLEDNLQQGSAFFATSNCLRDVLEISGYSVACLQLLRDIFGNPFRPVSLDPCWRTETVVALAGGIYAERAFDRMPILADALEDAGCDNRDILDHCRGDGPHVRGCWVVDLVLGKE